MHCSTNPMAVCGLRIGTDLVSTPFRELIEQAQCNLKAMAELCPHTVLILSDGIAKIQYRVAESNGKIEKACK